MKPNLGDYDYEPSWDDVLEYYAGTELHDHFKSLANKEIKSVVKPQYVDRLPKIMKGKINWIYGG